MIFMLWKPVPIPPLTVFDGTEAKAAVLGKVPFTMYLDCKRLSLKQYCNDFRAANCEYPHLNWLSRISIIIPNVRNYIYKYIASNVNRELKGIGESNSDILSRCYIHIGTNQ